MNQHQETMKKAVDEMITGPFDLVSPEHRINLEEVFKWFINNFVNATESPKWDDYWLAPGFEEETAKHAFRKFQPKQGDVLVATYAKTGTTWVTEVVRSMLYLKDKDILAKTKKLHHLYYYFEFGPVSKYQVLDNLQLPRRFLGTHLPAKLVNLEKIRQNRTKIIYVIRNPKDQAVSWYHFAKSLPYTKNEPWTNLLPQNEKEFYDIYLAGQQKIFGKEGEGYLEHVRGWYNHRNDSNVLFLVYENLKKDYLNELRKIAKFIDVDLSDDEVNQVAQMTSFNTMKKQADDVAKESGEIVKMFRKGQVGDWKNHLTVAQSELIDANVERVLGDTDIKFIYDLDQQ